MRFSSFFDCRYINTLSTEKKQDLMQYAVKEVKINPNSGSAHYQLFSLQLAGCELLGPLKLKGELLHDTYLQELFPRLVLLEQRIIITQLEDTVDILYILEKSIHTLFPSEINGLAIKLIQIFDFNPSKLRFFRLSTLHSPYKESLNQVHFSEFGRETNDSGDLVKLGEPIDQVYDFYRYEEETGLKLYWGN